MPPPLALGSAAVGLPVPVVDRLEGSSHIGQFLHVSRTAQIPNVSCACSCCGTAAPLGQPKSKGRAGATWSLLAPSYPKLSSLLADPKEGVCETRSQEIPHRDIQVCSLSPPLLAALGHVTRAQHRPDRLSGRLSGIVFSSLINGANSSRLNSRKYHYLLRNDSEIALQHLVGNVRSQATILKMSILPWTGY